MVDAETKIEGGRIVWRLRGPLDSYTAGEVAAVLARIDPSTDLVVDLDECNYIDTAGLLVLRDRALSAGDAGGSVVVRCVSPRHRRFFEQTGFGRLVVLEEEPIRTEPIEYRTGSAERTHRRYRQSGGEAVRG